MNNSDDQFAERLEQHLHRQPPTLNELNDDERAETQALFAVADLLWEEAHGAPPLEADPIAAMLGLIPDSAQSLDPRALRHAMSRARLSPSDLARQLSGRGWDVAARDVFNWQTKTTADVPPALIRAIAEVTGTTTEQLTTDLGASPSQAAIRAVVKTAAFITLARRWALIQRTSVDDAAMSLSARLATSVHRGAHPDEKQMLASLEALVRAVEAESLGEDDS